MTTATAPIIAPGDLNGIAIEFYRFGDFDLVLNSAHHLSLGSIVAARSELMTPDEWNALAVRIGSERDFIFEKFLEFCQDFPKIPAEVVVDGLLLAASNLERSPRAAAYLTIEKRVESRVLDVAYVVSVLSSLDSVQKLYYFRNLRTFFPKIMTDDVVAELSSGVTL